MSERSSASSSRESRRVAAVVVAGGSGSRMGASGAVRKQYLDLDGVPVLQRAVTPFRDHPRIGAVVLVLPPDDAVDPPGWIRDLAVTVAAGGRERSDSVRNGLSVLPADTETVLVHDAARPFVTTVLIDRVVGACADAAAVPGIPATDTLKEVEAGLVVRTVDRSRIWLAQTPQGFPFRLLVDAHRRAAQEGWRVTDDASLCERIGIPVRVVDGDPRNIKITQPLDLEIASVLARAIAIGPVEEKASYAE